MVIEYDAEPCGILKQGNVCVSRIVVMHVSTTTECIQMVKQERCPLSGVIYTLLGIVKKVIIYLIALWHRVTRCLDTNDVV